MTLPRALLVAPDWAPNQGGIARLLDALVRETADMIEWRVITKVRGPADQHVRRALGWHRFTAACVLEAGWLRGAADRLVVCAHAFAAAPALAAAGCAGAPLAAIVYAAELQSRARRHRASVTLLMLARRIVAISEHAAALARARGLRPDRITVVQPVLSPPWIAERPLLRAPRDPLRLVAISRLVEGYKNLEILLRAASMLVTTGIVERLTIVGDGARRSVLAWKAEALGIGQIVELPGAVADETLSKLLATSHVGLFPSRDSIAEASSEGFGLVIQELAAAGLPVLCGRAGGAVDAADPSWSILLDPDDVRAWATALENLHANEALRVQMATAALAWAHRIDASQAPQAMLRAMLP